MAAARTAAVLMGVFGTANLVGAVLVFVFLNYISQTVTLDEADDHAVVMTFAAYLLVTAVAGGYRGFKAMGPLLSWLGPARPPDDEERRATLRLPWTLAWEGFLFWLGAAVIFGVLNAAYGVAAREVVRIAMGILLGGATTSAMTYLLAERVLRPVFADALAGSSPPESRTVGIRTRLIVSWALGSGVPLLGIGLSPLLGRPGRSGVADLAILAGIGLLVGGGMTAIAARSVSDRLRVVREALGRVQAGDTDVEVPVDEPGEVGLLEAGFNQMVAGLRERQHLHDLFGRHVGSEVASRALERGAGLGGEQREASVLFVDLIGSTALASSRSADEVVAVLNALFGTTVRVAGDEGGWVNKFEGDGALVVFGAPGDQPDHAARALRAACRLREELARAAAQVEGLDVGIGVSTGNVVAGNVGAEERYEYTVVGDPVNEAARLTELAKTRATRLLVSHASVVAAGGGAGGWKEVGAVQLRGRDHPTVTYEPDGAAFGAGVPA